MINFRMGRPGKPKVKKLREHLLGLWPSSNAGCRGDDYEVTLQIANGTHPLYARLSLASHPLPERPRCGDRLIAKHVLMKCQDFELQRTRYLRV